MNKIDVYPTDTKEPICLLDYLIPESENTEKIRHFGEDTFVKRIGGTTYEVSTHFNPNGRQSALEQFKQLILSENLI